MKACKLTLKAYNYSNLVPLQIIENPYFINIFRDMDNLIII